MKRFALAGLLAVAVVIGVQQRASATGFGFSANVGVSFNFNCWCNPSCTAPCAAPCMPCTYGGCGYGSYYPGFNYGGYPYPAPAYGYGYDAAPQYPAYAQNYGAPYQAAPQMGNAYAPQAQVQPVGYYPYAYSNGYGYQAPNYWYGR